MKDDRKFWWRCEINNMLKICLNIADLIDEWGHEQNLAERTVTDALGLGYRALSSYLRQGAKAVIDLQAKYRDAIERRDYAEMAKKGAEDFLADVFGDPDIDSINEEDKKRIRELCRQIAEEWEKEDE